jgi:hypothetical protein
MTTPYALTRGYDQLYDRIYGPDASAVPPSTPGLISVYWDGLALNTGDDPATGLCSVIENVDGWLDSPPLNGHDAELVLADGAGWGVKTLGPRTITLSGAAVGPRDQLGRLRDQLAVRAAGKQPADLTITDAGALDRALTASVRGTDQFKLTWLSRYAYRWQATMLAADPALYDAEWQQAVLSNGSGGTTGRPYKRIYTWQYAASYLPNSQLLVNDGNWPSPVFALYQGDLAQSQLSDDQGGVINLAAITAGQQILVYTATLAAVTSGGLSRASYVLAGSVPMVLAAESTARWHLYGAGLGSVTLAWRSAWV